MWWYLVKVVDGETRIVYSYGRETREQTGEIEYDRKTNTFRCLKLADGDTESALAALYTHFARVIFIENAPDTRLIATG